MRTYIRVGIKLLAPFRVGGWLTQDQAAQNVGTLRDPLDDTRPFVPGSGLAGSLRAQAGENAEALFGPPSGETLSASPWWVLGTRLADEVVIVQRGQTPIDRDRRAAASKGFRTADEVLPATTAGADLYVYLTSDRDPESMLAVLRKWQPTIGAGISSGLGDAEVVSIGYRTLSEADPEDLLALVSHNGGAGPERIDSLLAHGHDVAPQADPKPLALEARLELDDLLVNPDDPQWHAASWLHGSTWKGILRSRVEYISRCVGLPTCPGTSGAEEWTGCGECPVCVAFGSASSGQGCWTFACSDQEHDAGALRQRSRTAIDRFTGGYRAQALFTEHTMKPHEITLTVTWGRAPVADEPNLDGVSRALVRALGDLDDGIIGLGGRTGTGLGRVSVTDLELGVRPGTPEGPVAGFIGDLPAGPTDLALLHDLPVKEAR